MVDYEKEFKVEEVEETTDPVSPYKVDDTLLELKYEYDLNAVYIPFKDYKPIKNTEEMVERGLKWEKVGRQRVHLKISRNKNKECELTYAWVSKKGNKKKGYTYKTLKSFKRENPITAEDTESTSQNTIINKLATTGNKLGFNLKIEDYEIFFSKEVENILNSDTLSVLKENEYIFPSYGELNTSNDINNRINPVLTREELAMAEEVENKIKEMGYVEYMDKTLKKMHIGDNREIMRKILLFFTIITGQNSAISMTDGSSEKGKTYEDDIALDHIPERYIFRVNDMTKASFTRYSEIHERYFDRMICVFGDLGSKKAFAEMEDVFNIFKILITEHEYCRELTDKVEGSYENVKLKLIVDSIGVAFQTTKFNFLDEEGDQLASRSFKSTPAEVDQEEVLDNIGAELGAENTKTNKNIDEAKAEFKKFQSYILYMINKDFKIVIPWINVFKRFVLISNTPYREMKQIMRLFRAFCVLTYFKCEEIGSNGELLATQDQLETFMNKISLENALPPSESAFLKMLIGEGTKTGLTIVETENEDNINIEDDTGYNPLNQYFNHAIEELCGGINGEKQGVDTKGITFDTLNKHEIEEAINKLLYLYRLKGQSSIHKENVFFTVKDVKRTHAKRKAYKNIEDVPQLLNKLYKNGFIDKLDYKDSKHMNIYYLTSKCGNIYDTIKVTETDKEKAREFLRNEWLGEGGAELI